MSRRLYPWNLLKTDSSADIATIRKAYADLLRAMNPDDDPAAFAHLRQARDRALALARSRILGEEDEALDVEHGDMRATSSLDPDTDNYDDQDDLANALKFGPGAGANGQLVVDAGLGGTAPVMPPMLNGLGDHDGWLRVASPAISNDFCPDLVDPAFQLRAARDDAEVYPASPRLTLSPPALSDRYETTDAVQVAASFEMDDDAVLGARYALDDLLASDQPLDTTEAGLLLHTVLADPSLDRIGERMRVESWLAGAVARALPRSMPFVRTLADHFGWREEAKSIAQQGTVALLTDYALALDFRARLERPNNKGYKAWRALTGVDPAPWHGLKPPNIQRLMTVISDQHPLLERDYDPQRFDYWAERIGKFQREGNVNIGWWIISIVVALFIFGRALTPDPDRGPDFGFETDSEQVARVQLEEFDDPLQRRRAIDDVLRAVGGPELTTEAVEAHDGALYRALDERLLSMRGQVPRLEAAEPPLTLLLTDRVRAALRDADMSAVIAYRQAQLALLEDRRELQRNNTRCEDILRGAPDDLHMAPVERKEAWRTAQRRLLLGSRAPALSVQEQQNFNLLLTTLADAERRAGMTSDQFSQAFAGNSSASANCRANAAILGVALARPGERDRLDVLRRL